MFLSLDVNKAFDILSWPYLTMVLRHNGFEAPFLRWISALYDSPPAKVKYYGFELSLFPIRRRTRQGCPLSPLLFILALVEAVRSHPDITGLEVAGSSQKI